jgi:predicted DCC family thiol-disulfide oxidoreductase YuxK
MTPGAGTSRIMETSEGLARNRHYRLNSIHRSSAPAPDGPRPIVFFDGDCGLCDRFVWFLVARDQRQRLHFAPLQGDTARHLIPPPRAESIDSVILLDRDGLHVRSEAALRAIAALGGAWRLTGALRGVPRGLRDAIYDFVATNRYRWFGRARVCPLPSRSGRGRFLP